jgi:hypothetical protein
MVRVGHSVVTILRHGVGHGWVIFWKQVGRLRGGVNNLGGLEGAGWVILGIDRPAGLFP